MRTCSVSTAFIISFAIVVTGTRHSLELPLCSDILAQLVTRPICTGGCPISTDICTICSGVETDVKMEGNYDNQASNPTSPDPA